VFFTPHCTTTRQLGTHKKHCLSAGFRPDPLGQLTALSTPSIRGMKGREDREEMERVWNVNERKFKDIPADYAPDLKSLIPPSVKEKKLSVHTHTYTPCIQSKQACNYTKYVYLYYSISQITNRIKLKIKIRGHRNCFERFTTVHCLQDNLQHPPWCS